MGRGGIDKILKHVFRAGAAYGVLFIALLATILVHGWAKAEIHRRQQAAFDQAVAKYRHTTELYIAAYYNILNGISAFFSQDKLMDPLEFRDFLEAQGLRTNAVGMYDLGYYSRIRAHERADFLDLMRQLKSQENIIAQVAACSDTNYVLMHWDNFSDSNAPAIGSYIATEPRRLVAMNQARDNAEIACTEKLNVLIGRTNIMNNGFMLYAPVYDRGPVPTTQAERREKLKGFVFASFSAKRFWSEIFIKTEEPTIGFEVYDGLTMETNRLWFDSEPSVGFAGAAGSRHASRFQRIERLAGVGRQWTFHYSSLPAFEVSPEARIPFLILLAGGLICALLFMISWTQARARHHAEDLSSQLIASNARLAEEKERLTVTLGSIGDGVIALDTDERIVLLNRTAETLTGWSQTEVLGKNLEEVLSIQDSTTLAKVTCPTGEVLRSGLPWSTPKPIRLGNERNPAQPLVTLVASPLRDMQGQVVGVVVAIRDVSDKQRLLEEQIKTSKLESIGLLAGGIAHDFNNLLTTIVGRVSLARSEVAAHSEARASLREAELACDRARDLTQQLLTFAKGGAPIRQTEVLGDVIRESARFATHGSAARCHFELTEDMWPVDADKGQISQVIHNIVINAVEAVPEGGIIHIRSQNLVLKESSGLPVKAGRYVVISIADQGSGIRSEHLDKIFDPYFSTKQRGSGLGLATAYSIVKRHEGVIHVDSRLGEGSRFDIYLPASNHSLPSSPKPELAPLPKPGRILVMDDERPVLNTLSRMLTKLGYQVTAATDGHEAIAAYTRSKENGEPIEAVILDLTVPGGMGGEETLNRLRTLDPDIRAIVSSGYSNNPVMANHTAFGFKAMLAKPYATDQLVAALGEVMRS